MNEKSFLAFQQMSRTVAGSQLLGVAGLVLFALQTADVATFAGVISIALLLAASAFAVGGIVGFIFGIPRSLQEASATATTPRDVEETDEVQTPAIVRYAGNTSLEQISDWLTKIIVGVGLTQLMNVPGALANLGTGLNATLGNFAGSSILAPLEVVYFGIGGFFLGYLWTRLYLVSLLVESDEEARRASERDQALRAFQAATDLQSATGTRPGSTRDSDVKGQLRVLWVDDRPMNNRREIEQLEEQGIRVTKATSTDEALKALSFVDVPYSLVISDMARGIDRRAGYTLLKAMRDKEIQTPVVIYAGSGTAEQDAQAKDKGALGSTNSPIRLFELVGQALRSST